MKKLSVGLYVIFILLFIEATGWGLMNLFSKGNDFVENRHYDKIRAMLMSPDGRETVSKYIQVPYLTYIPNPGYVREGYVQHNTSGYRGDEVPLKKGSKYRILCLGGSTTYGTGVVDPRKSYPAQLQKILEESGQFPQGVEVINAGVEAATSAEELNYYNFKFRYYQPDLVILHSGANDALVFTDAADYQFDYTHYRKQAFHLEALSGGMRWMLHSRFLSFCLVHFIYSPMLYSSQDMFSTQGAKSLKIAHWTDTTLIKTKDRNGFFYYPFYQNHRQLIQNIIRDSAEVMDLTFGYNAEFYRENDMGKIKSGVDFDNSVIEQLSKELNVVLIPYTFTSISRQEYWLDDCHLTEEGEKEKALFVSKYILDKI